MHDFIDFIRVLALVHDASNRIVLIVNVKLVADVFGWLRARLLAHAIVLDAAGVGERARPRSLLELRRLTRRSLR